MKNIYIIRHGETDYNKSHRMQGRAINASLNGLGRSQAQAVCVFLEDKPITKIITSSLKRAIESVHPLSTLLAIELEKYTDLDEMDFGALEGKPFEEVKSDLKYLHDQWSTGHLFIAPDGGESPLEVFDRAGSKMKEIINNSDDDHIVFMLHGRLIRILLSEFLGLGLKNMHEIEHQNGAINHLSWKNGTFKAIELNITSHID